MEQVRCPRCRRGVDKPAHGRPVCPYCGFGSRVAVAAHAAHPGHEPGEPTPRLVAARTSAAAVISASLALTALALAWVPLVNLGSLLLSLEAVVFGAIGLHQTKGKRPARSGKAWAITGLAVGGFVFLTLIILLLIVFSQGSEWVQDWWNQLQEWVDQKVEEESAKQQEEFMEEQQP